MRPELEFLLTAAVLATGTAAACSVIESEAPDDEPLPIAAVPAHVATAAEAQPAQGPEAPQVAQIDFTAEIQPLFEGCRPCHFEGGKMYARLPFDDPATIRQLGEKLFTRIKDEEARTLIRAFVAQAE